MLVGTFWEHADRPGGQTEPTGCAGPRTSRAALGDNQDRNRLRRRALDDNDLRGLLTWWITPVIQTSPAVQHAFFDIHGIVVFGYVMLRSRSACSPARHRPPPAGDGNHRRRVHRRACRRDAGGPEPLHADRDAARISTPGTRRCAMTSTATGSSPAVRAGAEVSPSTRSTNSGHSSHPGTAIFVALAVSLFTGAIYWARRRIA
jgi:hypothetical protein